MRGAPRSPSATASSSPAQIRATGRRVPAPPGAWLACRPKALESRWSRGIFFPPGQGAFGCEAEERPALLELARVRAGDWPAAATVEIGDTREDVTTAKAAGFRSIAVSSPRTCGRAELADADVVVDDMDGIVQAVLDTGR